MKHRLLIPLAALLLVLSVAMPAAAADPERSLSGSWASADGYDFAAPGCPAGALLRFDTSGRTEVTHLGLTAVTIEHCTFVNFAEATGTITSGTMTLTAANGDTL